MMLRLSDQRIHPVTRVWTVLSDFIHDCDTSMIRWRFGEEPFSTSTSGSNARATVSTTAFCLRFTLHSREAKLCANLAPYPSKQASAERGVAEAGRRPSMRRGSLKSPPKEQRSVLHVDGKGSETPNRTESCVHTDQLQRQKHEPGPHQGSKIFVRLLNIELSSCSTISCAILAVRKI